MKKQSLFLMLFCIVFIYAKSQWGPVPGYQTVYTNILGITRYQGDIWIETRIGIYRIVGSSWQLTSGNFIINGFTSGCMYSDGVNLYAGGYFTFGSQNVLVIRWDGSQWVPFAYTNDLTTSRVSTILKTPTNLYVGGVFNSIGTQSNISNFTYWAVFNGTSWTQPFSVATTGCAASIESIQLINDSMYVAGGFYEAGGIWTPATFRFKEGGGMTTLDDYGFCQLARDYQMFQNKLYVGGTRVHDVLNVNTGLAKRNGNSWSSVSSTMQLIDTKVAKILGKLFIAGVPGGGLNSVPTNICSYDGVNFANEGVGISSPNSLGVHPSIYCMFADTIENKLYVGGNFLQADGNVADNFAVKDFSPLAVRLVSFTAQLINQKVHLEWQDETPENGVLFKIQMSTNDRPFEDVGQVIERDNQKKYTFDITPTTCGNLQFRLAFEDTKYSHTVPIANPCIKAQVYALQNSLIVRANNYCIVTLCTLSGQKVFSRHFFGGVSTTALTLPKGVYIATIADTREKYCQKVVIY